MPPYPSLCPALCVRLKHTGGAGAVSPRAASPPAQVLLSFSFLSARLSGNTALIWFSGSASGLHRPLQGACCAQGTTCCVRQRHPPSQETQGQGTQLPCCPPQESTAGPLPSYPTLQLQFIAALLCLLTAVLLSTSCRARPLDFSKCSKRSKRDTLALRAPPQCRAAGAPPHAHACAPAQRARPSRKVLTHFLLPLSNTRTDLASHPAVNTRLLLPGAKGAGARALKRLQRGGP